MKIAIAGAGVAGSYLGFMLQKQGHDVTVFESSTQENHWAVCAWGASRNILENFSKNVGLNFEEYIFHEGKKLRMELPNDKEEYLELIGLVTYDKQKWERDLLKNLTVKYQFKCSINSFPFVDYDYVLDCTGVHRSLLPKSKSDFIIPAYEYLIENLDEINIENDFYVIGYKNARGYFWYFPLNNGRAYVGAGDIDRKYYGINEFFQDNPSAKIIKKIGRPIRLAPPKRMEPFFHNNVIGIGESIGCVFPMLGEGIIPSLLCCEIFLNVLGNSNKFDFKKYQNLVLKKFDYYDDVYRIVRLKMDNKLSTIKHFPLMMKMYKNMKKDEKRFGFEINLEKMTKLVNSL